MVKKVREMTKEEKCKLVENTQVDTSDIPKSPKEAFIKELETYVENMQEQVTSMNTSIFPAVQTLIKCLEELNKNNPCTVYEETLKTHKQMSEDMRVSSALMTGRIELKDEVLEFVDKNYEVLVKLDFFLKGVMGLEDAKSLSTGYVDKYNKA